MRQTGSTNGSGGKHRAKRRRLQPYAWLGAGAVTLGVGAALAGGTAVAYADTGSSGGSAKSASASSDSSSPGSSDSSASDSSSTAKKTTAHSARSSSKVSSSGGNTSSRSSAPTSDSSSAGTAGSAAAGNAGAAAVLTQTSATVTTTSTEALPEPTPVTSTTVAHTARVTATKTAATQTSSATSSSTAETTSTATALPADSVTPSATSYLPTNPKIVAGVAYQLGRQQLVDAQTELNAATWGSGNIAGGLAAIVPNLLLASASATLDIWQGTNAGAQGFFASTANIPIIHQIAGGNLLANILLPSLAGAEMNTAAFLLPLVGLFTGSGSMTPVSNSLSAAMSNTRVYGFVPVSMKATTEPVVYLSVNGGPSVPVLVDTGSSGLVISYNAVNQNGLGSPTGSGSITYSGAPTDSYDYNIYTTTVDFGNGIVSGPTSVDVVTQADSAAFENFLSWGADGILGIGANAAGPGPSLPTTSLPGELSDGVLLYQGLFFGLGGLMIFGQNAMPVRASVSGAPDAWLQVQVNNGAKTTVGSIIDSGGVYGTMLQSIVGGAVGSTVPAGTKISVYTPDGNTLLYSYTTTSYGSPTVISTGLINTGYYAFQQGPVYINYAYNNPYGVGSTDFNYA